MALYDSIHAGDDKTIPLGEIAHSSPERDWVLSLSDEEFRRENNKLKRKVSKECLPFGVAKLQIDLRILPTLFILLILNYLDRNGLALARVQGVDVDLGLVNNQFNTAISVFFAGYIVGQIPSNLILPKVRPSLYLPGFVALWGVISASTAAADNFSHLVVIRFFLGLAEAPYFPGVLFLLSSWYTKKELAFRTSILYTGAHLSGAFAGLIAAGVQSGLDGAKGLESWR